MKVYSFFFEKSVFFLLYYNCEIQNKKSTNRRGGSFKSSDGGRRYYMELKELKKYIKNFLKDHGNGLYIIFPKDWEDNYAQIRFSEKRIFLVYSNIIEPWFDDEVWDSKKYYSKEARHFLSHFEIGDVEPFAKHY